MAKHWMFSKNKKRSHKLAACVERGIVMNSEQLKIKNFFDKFILQNSAIVGMSWILIAVCFIFQFIDSLFGFDTMIRTAILYHEDWSVTFITATLVGPILGYLRLLPYQTFNMNQKSTAVKEILKYHPIDKKMIRNRKVQILVKFMFKVTLASIMIHIFSHMLRGIDTSWFNILYIVVLTFVWSVAVNMIAIYLEK